MFRPKAQALSLFDRDIVRRAVVDSFKKLAPRLVAKNPVMFVVEIGSVLTTAIWLRDLFAPPPGAARGRPSSSPRRPRSTRRATSTSPIAPRARWSG